MSAAAPAPSPPGIGPAQVIVPYLDAPEDVIRCAAARALAVLGDESAAPALVEALMDPDPDLRADAMAALVRCARPEDAPAIRRSLKGDPVPEVKIAAVQALARLKDEPSIPLLRGLARSRCEAEVAWEEEGAWDDWLDIQVAAIEALGAMGAADAVDDLVRARGDEDGQDLDHVVIGALAGIPGPGVETVRGFLGHGDARVRQRALAALSGAARDLLLPMREALVRDPSPHVRRLAIDCFEEGDEALATLALEDPDASVRAAALACAAPMRPHVLRSALHDSDETVRAVALEARGSRPAGADEPDLVANVEAWLRTASSRLARICATVLPTLAGADALHALRGDGGRRLAASRRPHRRAAFAGDDRDGGGGRRAPACGRIPFQPAAACGPLGPGRAGAHRFGRGAQRGAHGVDGRCRRRPSGHARRRGPAGRGVCGRRR